MCARYTQTKNPDQIKTRFRVDIIEGDSYKPRYNIAPTQEAPVVFQEKDKRILSSFRFGMIPHWAKDMTIASKLIQARSDTILERPSYKQPFLQRRCLVVADGFYEWQEIEGSNSKPHHFCFKDRDLFAVAGIWSEWKDPKGEKIRSYTIITTDADSNIKPIHHRMPVLITEKDEEAWLDPENHNPDKLIPMLKSSCEGIGYYPVSTIVNSPKNIDERCIVRLAI